MSGLSPNASTSSFSRPPEGDERKTAAPGATCPVAGSPRDVLRRRPDGSVKITGFDLASQILRGRNLKQAGFNADMVARLPQKNTSILFKDGEDHRRQRSAVARFFAPAVVAGRYRTLMSDLSLRLVQKLVTDKRATLDDMSLDLSVAVAAEITGLTESLLPGIGNRLSRFFTNEIPVKANWWDILVFVVTSQVNLFLVYFLDVRPAIKARKRAPREDLLSHLVAQKWSVIDILTECITYSTAGMSTTREFIIVAAWHLLEREDLRQRFLDASEAGRHALLEEILRLEPAVGTLSRRATQKITLDNDGVSEEIAAGTLLEIDVRAVNADPEVAGRCPYHIDPDRAQGRAPTHMSFGDGPHKCPGAAVAIQETAIFLDHLLRVPNLRLARTPDVSWNKTTAGYVLRGAVVTVG